MMHLLFSCLVIVPATLVVDALARPRSKTLLRRGAGSLLLVLITFLVFGILLALSGNPFLAAILVLALHLLFVVASNAKNDMLGEPLLFSDLALISAVFQHPQFYFSALSRVQKMLGIIAFAALTVAFVWLFEVNWLLRLSGLAIGLIAWALLRICLRMGAFRTLGVTPDARADVSLLGLISTLLLYWTNWRADAGRVAHPVAGHHASLFDGGPKRNQHADPEIIVAIQCESFADPLEIFGDQGVELPNLEGARRQAVLWGNLLVSGFGAYTMRTEYGVLFGQEEEALGFRRYDPYLTAMQDGVLALPRRLGIDRWRSVFIHPHDMRFYSRHRILPEAGFAELIDDRAFDRPSAMEGRYVRDAAVADKILEVARATTVPTFLYAVTIENHGPWSSSGGEALVAHYNRLVQAGDAMLGQLRDGIAALRRPAILAFFGDHRPSIPGASEPGGDRHTPFVILRFDADGQIVPGDNRREDITPASLHHALLALGRQAEE